MDPLTLTLTTAGLLRFTAAQGRDDIDLTVASVGVTDSVFVVSPTLTALPGELKRLPSVSGAVVGPDLVHVTVRDTSADGYGVRGFGLFLGDGTLFAVYGSAGRIVEKSPQSVTLFALDIAFPANIAAAIRFGDTNFLYPPATESTKGVARLATDDEVGAAELADAIVTPRGLRRIVEAIGALRNRAIRTEGLATGGGDLTADRTVTVARATAADADGGQLDDRALTPLSLVNILARISTLFGRNIFTTGLATGGGPLTADRTVTVPRASGAETDALVVDDKAVTPYALTPLVARIMARIDVLRARNIRTAGLATGGGDLTDDRTVTVARASSTAVRAGVADDSAITPAALAGACGGKRGWSGWYRHPNGLIEQWGDATHDATGRADVVFPIPFTTDVFPPQATNAANGPPTAWPGCGAVTLTGMTIWASSATGAPPAAAGVATFWHVWGF